MRSAALGVGLPLLSFVAEGLWLRTRDRTYYDLARTWAKAMAILFAVGAVSGTILSFELGLLWPQFMCYAGGLIGLPFSLEGFAFFIEAIFIGLYLYGWERLSPVAHWLTVVPIVLSGAISAAFVTCVTLLGTLVARRYAGARVVVACEVVAILTAWFAAQSPYRVAHRFTYATAASPDAVLEAFLIATAAGAGVLLPSLALLLSVFKRVPRRPNTEEHV